MDACDWEQEIEDVIEQSAFGETQRAKSVYIKLATKKHKSHKKRKLLCEFCAFLWLIFIWNKESCE
jgi:hypothetical protein